MFDKKLPLSCSDFASGRFDEVATFVCENWPHDNKPTHEEAREIVAKTIGYKDYSDAHSSATEEVSMSYSIFFDFERNFAQLGYPAIKKPKSEPLDMAARIHSLLGGDDYRNEFVKSWPLRKLLNRWNFENNPCTFDIEFIKSLEPFFEAAWSNNLSRFNGFQTSLEHTSSAASVVASLASDLQLDELSSKSISQLLDDEIIQAIFSDAMPMVFKEIFTINDSKAKALIEYSGLSVTDLINLPKNDAGFPNLFQHMRDYLKNVILARAAISLYTIERTNNSFFYEPKPINLAYVKQGDSFPVTEGLFAIFVERDELESSDFRTYSWKSQLQDENGAVLAHGMGTYISGSATKSTSGFSLISAADEMCDDDVEVVDIVLTHLQNEILEEHGEDIDKSSINTRLLFKDGNLVTVLQWERSNSAPAGSGLSLILNTIDRLKKRFKRNVHIAAVIQPYQYKSDAGMHAAIENQRQKDIKKINSQLFKVGFHNNVLNIFTKGHERADGDTAFFKYCGENYLNR